MFVTVITVHGCGERLRFTVAVVHSEVHNRNTRNRDRLHIPLCRTTAGQRAFTFRDQRLWNSLPDEFQSITNLDVFKVKIKQHFLRVFLEN